MSRQDLIEKYISGTISAEEMKEVISLCEDDASFKEEFQFHKDLKKVAAHEDDLIFKETLRTFENDQSSSKKNPRIWWIAASFIGVLLITYFFNFTSTSTEELFAENFEPYRNVIQPIVRGGSDMSLLSDTFISYENKEYDKAIQGFSELIETEDAPYASFYLANSYLASNNAEKAIPLLQQYIKNQDSLKDKATWYLALAYIKSNQQEQAILILESILSSQGYQYENATNLLSKLK